MSIRANLLDNVRRVFGQGSRTMFPGSGSYWEHRYKKGGTSGNGSYGKLAEFKAEILNSFIHDHRIDSAMEFGCGDGNQLGLVKCSQYIGVDVSATAIGTCREKYKTDPTKRFILADASAQYPPATMTMSLDVIYHLVEDSVYDSYMKKLFESSDRYVVIYSSNGLPETPTGFTWPPHVIHRVFTEWVNQNATGWKLMRKIANRYPYKRIAHGKENGSFADFYIYERVSH